MEGPLGMTKVYFLVSADKRKCILGCAGGVIGGVSSVGNEGL